QHEQSRLVWGICIGAIVPGRTIAPGTRDLLHDLADRQEMIRWRPEIECGGEFRASFVQRSSKHEVTAQGTSYVLPWTNGFWIADSKYAACGESSYRVRDDPIFAPITSTDDVSGACCRNIYAMLSIEE